jgi:hypothetical protein
MNDSPSDCAALPSIRERDDALLINARRSIRAGYGKFENRIRISPVKAVLVAAAVGYVLNRLPVRTIMLTQTRVLSALAPPALLLFGAAKLIDCLRGRQED